MDQVWFEGIQVWDDILEGGDETEFRVKEGSAGFHLHHRGTAVVLWAALWCKQQGGVTVQVEMVEEMAYRFDDAVYFWQECFC